ncbi:hypothetical protein PFISCL1PPCAC_2627, partial [Pristionchus fissidentatus]
SNAKMYLIFLFQFLFVFALSSPILITGVERNEKGCITDIDNRYQVFRSMVGAFYSTYCIFSATLTTLTIRRIRASETIKTHRNRRHLSLVRYSIYCSFAQTLKGVLQVISAIGYWTHIQTFTDIHLLLVIFFPVNIFTVTSSLFLLVIFSHSVRRRIRRVRLN